jgi:hypothetical protein
VHCIIDSLVRRREVAKVKSTDSIIAQDMSAFFCAIPHYQTINICQTNEGFAMKGERMRKTRNLIGIVALIAAISVIGSAYAIIYPNNEISDVYSVPNGYAEPW